MCDEEYGLVILNKEDRECNTTGCGEKIHKGEPYLSLFSNGTRYQLCWKCAKEFLEDKIQHPSHMLKWMEIIDAVITNDNRQEYLQAIVDKANSKK